MAYFYRMNGWAFLRSQLRRRSWIKTEAKVETCVPADNLCIDYCLWVGAQSYYIQVRYSANGGEVLTQFRWNMPWTEGDTLPLRYDPANPECNDRTGIWLARNALLWILIGAFFLIGWLYGWWPEGARR